MAVGSSASANAKNVSCRTQSIESQQRSCSSTDTLSTSGSAVRTASKQIAPVSNVQSAALSALDQLEALRLRSVENTARRSVDVEERKSPDSATAEQVSAEAQRLDPTKYNSAEELLLAVKPEGATLQCKNSHHISVFRTKMHWVLLEI